MDNAPMTSAPPDPQWPRLVSLSVHELRTPMTVVAGYIRMLLKDRAGPVTDQQRRLLEEAEKSCGRLSALLVEMSDLANLEANTAPFNRAPVDLRVVLADTVAALPVLPDREIEVSLRADEGTARIVGDPLRLKVAFTSLLTALRRELVTSTELFVKERTGELDGRAASWIMIGDRETVAALEQADPSTMTPFDEWRGGSGLSVAVARRVINSHGGGLWSPASGVKAAAIVALPHA
jgi:light-regulated signal transduction histidine kinase (bacteriophytochrome)